MRQYHVGDRGEPIRDIQHRLTRLGHDTDSDPTGTFGGTTEQVVRDFQRSRGLHADGIVGEHTWQSLVDAGYGLGDRMLYRRVPLMRGDDISALQQAFNSLGFDAGKVDGLFGPETLAAVLDFQHNRGMAEDGIVGAAVAEELALMHRETSKRGREAVREQAWISSLPQPIAGTRVYLDPAWDEQGAAGIWQTAMAAAGALREAGAMPLLSRSIDTNPDEHVRARRANRLDAELVVSFVLARSPDQGVFFFGTDRSSSPAGRVLAESLGHRLGLTVEARATPILRETRSPAVVVAVAQPDERVGLVLAEVIEQLYLHGVPERLRK